jgi:hypothetical protein
MRGVMKREEGRLDKGSEGDYSYSTRESSKK